MEDPGIEDVGLRDVGLRDTGLKDLYNFLKRADLGKKSEEKLIDICDRIDTKYTIPELIQFLERYYAIDKEQWLEEFKYYLIEFKVQDLLKSFDYFKEYLLKYPRIFHLIICAFRFILQTLVDVKITKFYQTNPLCQEFVTVFQRVISTVFHCSMKLCVTNANYHNTNDRWETITCSDHEKNLVFNGQKIIDIGAWKEYLEYLDKTNMLEPKEN